MLAIYFQLNFFSKSHQKPPCDVLRSTTNIIALIPTKTIDQTTQYESIKVSCKYDEALR